MSSAWPAGRLGIGSPSDLVAVDIDTGEIAWTVQTSADADSRRPASHTAPIG